MSWQDDISCPNCGNWLNNKEYVDEWKCPFCYKVYKIKDYVEGELEELIKL